MMVASPRLAITEMLSTNINFSGKKQNQWIADLLIDLIGECEEKESEMTQHLEDGLNNGTDVFVLRDGERNWNLVLDMLIFKYSFESHMELAHSYWDHLKYTTWVW